MRCRGTLGFRRIAAASPSLASDARDRGSSGACCAIVFLDQNKIFQVMQMLDSCQFKEWVSQEKVYMTFDTVRRSSEHMLH